MQEDYFSPPQRTIYESFFMTHGKLNTPVEREGGRGGAASVGACKFMIQKYILAQWGGGCLSKAVI